METDCFGITCNPSIQKAEQQENCFKYEVILGYIARPCLRKNVKWQGEESASNSCKDQQRLMYIIYKNIVTTNQEEKDDPIEIQVQSIKNELQRKWREPIN